VSVHVILGLGSCFDWREIGVSPAV
jgi:hypothetical protein